MRKTYAFIAPLLIAILIGIAPSAFAQQGAAELRGHVADAQGAVLPGVSILIRNEATGLFRQGVSTGDGSYFFAGITPGTYTITAELSGFKKSVQTGVALSVGQTTTVDVSLQLGGLEEEVTVSAEAPIIDITSKEVGGSVTSRELVELPTANRNFVGFLGLLPGMVPSISTESFGSDSVSTNGQDRRNNNYSLDGANNNDDVIGQRAGAQTRIPIEAVQEFQVLTNQYDAEFGRTAGAVINAITKQGGNEFHGSAFGFFQDDSITSTDFFTKLNNQSKPVTQRKEFGGTLGGPIVKDKAHFFVSLERVLISEASIINFDDVRPEFIASPSEDTKVWNTMIRFDHQINASNTWNVRWLRESSPQFNQIIGDVTLAGAREEFDVDQTIAATISSTFGNTKFNTLRTTFTREDVAFANPGFNAGNCCQADLAPSLRYLDFIDGPSTTASARRNNAFQVEDTFSWFVPGKHGDHDIKMGVQFEWLEDDYNNESSANGQFRFTGNSDFNPADPRTYPERLSIRVPSPLVGNQSEKVWAGFVQDKWRVNEKLTLSLGARWELEQIETFRSDNPFFTGGQGSPSDKNNIAPRLGFSYDVTGDGKTVVRGGVGRFYEKSHLAATGILNFRDAAVFSTSFNVDFPTTGADPGPGNGRLPTDPFLVNGPTVNRALLASLFPAGTTVRNTGTVWLDNPDRTTPYTDQFTAGFSRALRSDLSVSVDFIHSESKEMFVQKNLHPIIKTNTARTGGSRIYVGPDVSGTDFDPSRVGNIITTVNEGEMKYDALQVGIEKRYSNNFSGRISYTLGNARGNNAGNPAVSSFQFGNDLNLDEAQGPTTEDVRHNFVFSGTLTVPGTGGLTVSTIFRYLSGFPFSLENDNSDPNQNGILFDPIPAGSYSGTGDNAITVENDGGRNGARGPTFTQWDARLGYRIQIGNGRAVHLFADAFNLLDRTNFANPSGDQRSTNFLRLTALATSNTTRRLQVAARLTF